MHSSITVANQLIKLAEAEGKTLTPMQLIKLVYLCHAWMLGLYGQHLIGDPIEAWLYGPVIKVLYDEIKQYKSSPVCPIPQKNSNEEFSDLEIDLIKQVFNAYSCFTGIELSSLTHQKDGPWSITWNHNGQNAYISNDIIENYYRQLAKKNDLENDCHEK